MIFLLKHGWRRTLLIAIVGAIVTLALGGWKSALTHAKEAVPLVGWGLLGGLAALTINGVLHECFKRTIGDRYLRRFERYGSTILDGMRWPEYVTGGLLAAVVEEPFFRGLVLPYALHIDLGARSANLGALSAGAGQPAIGIAIAALVFGACHWLRREYFPFWIWAVWEGVFFGILMVVFESVLVPMVAHALHDVIAYRIFAALIRDR